MHGARHGDCSARCVATVGLGNALCAGDPPVAGEPAGTINLLCHVSTPLSELALLEALALAAEARTLALLEARVPSSRQRTAGDRHRHRLHRDRRAARASPARSSSMPASTPPSAT